VTHMKLAGVGSYAPEFVLTNEMLSEMVDTNDEWIQSRTGMRERHISTGETTWKIGAEAAKQALERSGIPPEDIDIVICTTVTADYDFPSASCVIAGQLGIKNAFCFDLNAACTGFIYALDIVAAYFDTDRARNAIIVSAEVCSKITDYTDRSTAILFGDGAGAAVFSAGGSGGLHGAVLHADGTNCDLVMNGATVLDNPFIDPAVKEYYGNFFPRIAEFNQYLRMDGQAVYRFATKAMNGAMDEVLEKTGLSISEIDYIIPHQANYRIIEGAAKRMKFPRENLLVNVEKFGNTSSATIPMCLCDFYERGQFKEGDRIILVGFGGGLTWGAAILEL
jgi:3-oxoacyl-[acyl-carrier-protein] synthase-3